MNATELKDSASKNSIGGIAIFLMVAACLYMIYGIFNMYFSHESLEMIQKREELRDQIKNQAEVYKNLSSVMVDFRKIVYEAQAHCTLYPEDKSNKERFFSTQNKIRDSIFDLEKAAEMAKLIFPQETLDSIAAYHSWAFSIKDPCSQGAVSDQEIEQRQNSVLYPISENIQMQNKELDKLSHL